MLLKHVHTVVNVMNVVTLLARAPVCFFTSLHSATKNHQKHVKDPLAMIC